MKKIYKYSLNTFGLPTKIKEKISRILSIQLQRDQVCVWIEIDDDAAEVTAEFLPIGTGLEFPKELTETYQYFDSIQENEYIWHFYWRYIE